MPTRSFVLEGPKRRFWDITWDGPSVEITSGTWGTNGRAREELFESVASRETFIAAEIKKIEKKGYRETVNVAPAADTSSTANARKVASMLAGVQARRRPTWLPQFVPGTEGTIVVRGPMTLDRDEAWPGCKICGEALSALLEIDLARVPAEHLRDDAVVQLFWCEAWQRRNSTEVCTVSGGWLARRHARGTRRELGPGDKPSFAASEFERCDEVPADAGELRDDFDIIDPDVRDDLMRTVGGSLESEGDTYDAVVTGLGLRARNKHKLGGFPTFVQDYEVPFLHQIFQIEENAPFDVNFGDSGAGHLLLGSRGAIQFTWASH